MTLLGAIIAFGGGIFGAAIGALPAFEFVGLFVIAGVAVQLGGGDPSYFGKVPFGVFGPHVGGFASGVAALAYAARVGKFDNGRNILPGMMGLNAPDVLLVGGAFGVFGYVVQYLLGLVPGFGPDLAWTDTVALTVVISALVARLLFGKTGVFGKTAPGVSHYARPADSIAWLPFQNQPGQLAVIGLGVGIMAGSFAVSLGAPGVMLAFGVAAASLVFLQFGVSVPVTHHIALPAAIVAAASGSVIWAGIYGIVCAFVGEFMARTFLVHGDTHIDPPAATIWPMTTVANALTAFGFFKLIPLL